MTLEITQEAIAHISTSEIEQDIADTEFEIMIMQRELKSFEMLSDRMSYMKAESRRNGIKERVDFVAKLKLLLAARAV